MSSRQAPLPSRRLRWLPIAAALLATAAAVATLTTEVDNGAAPFTASTLPFADTAAGIGRHP